MLREQRGLEAIIRILAILIPVADRLTTMDAVAAQYTSGVRLVKSMYKFYLYHLLTSHFS